MSQEILISTKDADFKEIKTVCALFAKAAKTDLYNSHNMSKTVNFDAFDLRLEASKVYSDFTFKIAYKIVYTAYFKNQKIADSDSDITNNSNFIRTIVRYRRLAVSV